MKKYVSFDEFKEKEDEIKLVLESLFLKEDECEDLNELLQKRYKEVEVLLEAFRIPLERENVYEDFKKELEKYKQ